VKERKKRKNARKTHRKIDEPVTVIEHMQRTVSEVNHCQENLISLSDGLKEYLVVRVKEIGALNLKIKIIIITIINIKGKENVEVYSQVSPLRR
jgi:hypothetical protein